MLVLRAGLVDTGGGSFTRTDILIGNGRILEMGAIQPPRDAEVFDASDYLVVPGMINAHTHSNENWFRGRFDNIPLDVWMLFAYPLAFAPHQTPREVYLRTALGAMEMLRGGTTCVVDFLYELPHLTDATLQAVVQAYRDTGMRALICLAVADRSFRETAALDPSLLTAEAKAELERRSPPPIRDWLELCRSSVARFHRPDHGISLGLAPAGPHRCTDDLLLACRDLADELDLQIHTHTLEIERQARMANRQYGRTVIEHLHDIGFLGPRVHLCHGVWTTDADAKVIATDGASLVHNPLSNLKLGSGVAPVPRLRRHGVHLALGTDGTCSGDGQDMFQAVKLAATLHKSPTLPYEGWTGATEAWAMATTGGARTVGRPDIGRLQPGHRADLVLLDLRHRAFVPLNDPLFHVALQVPTSAVRQVMVDGRWTVTDGRLLGVDEPALLAEARSAAPDVNARHERALAFGESLLPSVSAGWHRELEAE